MNSFLVSSVLMLAAFAQASTDLQFNCQFAGAVRPIYRKTISGKLNQNDEPFDVVVRRAISNEVVTQKATPVLTPFDPSESLAADYNQFDLTSADLGQDPSTTQYFLVIPKVLAHAPQALFKGYLTEVYNGGEWGSNQFELNCRTN